MSTRERRWGEDTPLNQWIRQHKELDSSYGYVGTDVDLVWYNHKLAFIMILEHKENMAVVRASQEATLSVLDQALRHGLSDPHFRLVSQRLHIPEQVYYCGWHCITCEHSSPLDGKVYVDDNLVTVEQLTQFLKFEWTPVIKNYTKQQERILQSRTIAELNDCAKFVKETIYSKHPETKLLRELFNDRRAEIKALEQLFTLNEGDVA